MAAYTIHKGVDKPVEFKGLQSQYLFIFAGGLIGVFLLVVVLYMGGVNQLVCLGIGAVLGLTLVLLTFRLNERFGTYGLMKLLATKMHPRRIINRRSIHRLIHIGHE